MQLITHRKQLGTINTNLVFLTITFQVIWNKLRINVMLRHLKMVQNGLAPRKISVCQFIVLVIWAHKFSAAACGWIFLLKCLATPTPLWYRFTLLWYNNSTISHHSVEKRRKYNTKQAYVLLFYIYLVTMGYFYTEATKKMVKKSKKCPKTCDKYLLEVWRLLINTPQRYI